MRRLSLASSLVLLTLAHATLARSQDKSYLPAVAGPSAEPEQARREIRVPADLTTSLFAAEPNLANPVAFAADAKGRFYVVETFRLHEGVTDNRNHMPWVDDDLASRTVADRVAMYRKWLGKDVGTYAVEHDRIRRLEDRDGDGKVDHDSVFAEGFKDLATGLAAGVLPTKAGVYFTCIPDLWLLKDTHDTGRADVREVLSTGYGVHVALLGHDMHGLIMGPDGRLYFSIGDRGFSVRTKEGKALVNPDSGAVLRCDPDGSNLEVFASGLRNPQELAFNNVGDLFTVDNNSDSGDKARVVHVVEGGQAGWRVSFQYIEKPNSRGPWNAEKLWWPGSENTGAYLLPPLANLSDGPSGLTFDPGVTLLPARFKDHFFLADFRGGHSQSGIRSFAVEPKGASYEVVDAAQPIWSVLATDVDFAPDGGLYVSDWVDGWGKTGKGRIWRVADPARAGDPAVAAVKAILGEGMSGRTIEQLGGLLASPDRRVRLAAQAELVERGTGPARAELTRALESGTDKAARLHAVWGLGQLARKDGVGVEALIGREKDADPEVRAQVAKVLGDVPAGINVSGLMAMLDDDAPRVRFQAAQALGRRGEKAAVGPLLALLAKDADRDYYLRHAASYALARIGEVAPLVATATDPSAPVRLGAVLALRRIAPETLGTFLKDADPKVVLEASRGIYDDAPTPGPAMDALAALAANPGTPEPTSRRALNAAARVGGTARAADLVRLARSNDAPQAIRAEALDRIGDWAKVSGRDPVTGLWRPYPARPKAEAVSALKPAVDDLLKPAAEPVRRAAIGAVGSLGIAEAVPTLVGLVADEGTSSTIRVDALKAIERIGDPRLADAVARGIDSGEPRVRAEAQRLLAKTDPRRAVPLLGKVLASGSVRERQGALAVLADLARPEADAILAAHLASKDLPGEAELDLLEAARRRASIPTIKAALAAHESGGTENDPLAGYRPSLLGGDSAKGRSIFLNNAAVYCVRCHKVDGQGGEVGPELTGIGKKQTREYLATSIVNPNAAIAQGFETVIVSLADGRVLSGVFKGEDARMLHLISVDGKPIDLAKADVEDRKRGPSSMPEDIIKKLTKSELRDLVEYLATRK